MDSVLRGLGLESKRSSAFRYALQRKEGFAPCKRLDSPIGGLVRLSVALDRGSSGSSRGLGYRRARRRIPIAPTRGFRPL